MINFHNTDNMKFMADVPDKYYDLAIVDPPYGIDVSEMNIGARKIKNKSCDNKGWDNNIPTDDYWNELYRVSKHQIVWGANYFNCFNGKNGAIIWHKNNPLPTSSDCEIASYSKHSKVAIYNKTWTNYVNDKQTNHPTEKPVALYEWLLSKYAKPNDKIIDTHGGSGSIAIAVDKANTLDNTNYSLDIIELDKDYFDASLKRFKDYYSQPKIKFPIK